MSTATVEVSGADAAHWAAELRATLVANVQPGDSVSPVELQRSAELVVAVIGMVFAGIDAAKTVWDWWHSRRPEGVNVTILFADGTQVDVSNVNRDELETILQHVASGR